MKSRLAPLGSGEQAKQFIGKCLGFFGGLVHLPVAGDDGSAVSTVHIFSVLLVFCRIELEVRSEINTQDSNTFSSIIQVLLDIFGINIYTSIIVRKTARDLGSLHTIPVLKHVGDGVSECTIMRDTRHG